MIFIEQINTILQDEHLNAFLIGCNFSNSPNKKMVGVTLDNKNNFVLKFYLELASINDVNVILKFKKFFNKIKNKIDFTIPTSLATGFKINSNNECLDYVHFKFARKLSLKPKSSKLKFIGLKDCKFGASIEQTNKNRVLKKYFYYFSKRDKELVKKLFNLNINIDEVYHFEVYETKDNVKVNIIYDFYKNDIAFLSENNLEHFAPSVEAFNAYFKKTPKYFGLDKKGNLSFYYSFTE